MTLRVGEHAPDFDLETTDGHRSLRQFLAEGALVLVFYREDEGDESMSQMGLFAAQHESLSNFSAVILGVSSSDLRTQFGFLTRNAIPYSLGTDPDLAVARMYQADDTDGHARPVVYVIGEDGRISGVIDPWEASKFSQVFDALGLG